MEDRVFFNCSYWNGRTIIQGSQSFFDLLSELLDSVCEFNNCTDEQLDALYEKTLGTPANAIYNIIHDIESSASSTDNKLFTSNVDILEDWFFFRYKNVFQLIVTKQIAFELGERIRLGLQKVQCSQENGRAMWAFSRVVQTVAVGATPTKKKEFV